MLCIVGGLGCKVQAYQTPEADGVYYLYNPLTGKFASRGSWWGTRALADEFGVPIKLIADGTKFKLYCPDNEAYYGDDYWMYADCTGERVRSYTISGVDGILGSYIIKHVISDVDYSMYINMDEFGIAGNAIIGGSEENCPDIRQTYWQFLSIAEHDAIVNNYPNKNKQNVIDASGITGITTSDLTVERKWVSSDATSSIGTAKFDDGVIGDWSWSGTDRKHEGYPDYASKVARVYEATGTFSQTISGLEAGIYKLTMGGFDRHASESKDKTLASDYTTVSLSYLQANDEKVRIKSWVEMNTAMGKEATTLDLQKEGVNNGKAENEVFVYLNGTENLVIKVAKPNYCGESYLIFNNFTLTRYRQKAINEEAAALTSGSTMTPNIWYYFDVAADAPYVFTATDDVNNIVYTTDGTEFIANETSITSHFSAKQSLSAGRYYIKSSSEQTLTFAEASYTVGSATSSLVANSYLQSISTVTLNFESATTNDTQASLALSTGTVKLLDSSDEEVAIAELSLDGTTVTATFSDVTLDAGTTYTLAIAANVIGYVAGSTYNAAQNVMFKTPAIFDGVYYLKDVSDDTYLSRSGNYGTQAIMDNKGLAIHVTTDASNNTQLQYFDNRLYFGFDGPCYGDASGDNIRNFNVTAVVGGYRLLNTNNSKYMAVSGSTVVANAEENDVSNVWTFENTSAHIANYTANANAQVVTAVTNIPALSSITTKADLEVELAENYAHDDIAITGAKDEKYQEYAGSDVTLSENTYYSETVSGLIPGLYKLSVDAFQRATWNDWVVGADGARGTIYLYANTAKTQLKSLMEHYADVAYTLGTNPDFADGDKHYPNSKASAYEALENLDFSNDVYVYVPADPDSETGTLEIGIKNPTRQGNGVNNGTWVVYNNWTLTYYGPAASASEKSALASAISSAEDKTLGFEDGEYAPYMNVAAIKALKRAKSLQGESKPTSSSVTVATATLSTAVWSENDGEVNAIYDGNFAIQDEDTEAPASPLGWTPGGSDLIRQIIKNQETYLGLAQADAHAGIYVWGAESNSTYTYGGQEGYTLPLGANAYELRFKVASWTDGNASTNVNVSVYKEDGTQVGMTKNLTYTAGKINSSNPFASVSHVFALPEAGNYLIRIETRYGENAVLTDFDLRKATAAVLNETSTDYTPVAGPANVTLNRTFSATYNTVVLPFSMTAAQVEDVFGDGAIVYAYSEESVDAENATVSFNSKAENTIEANVPVLVKATKASTVNTINGVTISAAGVDDVEGTNFDFVGTFTNGTALQAGDYFIGVKEGVGYLYRSNGVGNTMKGFRAYIKPHADADVKNLWLNIEDDIETRIVVVDGEIAEPDDELIYNMAGQRVQKTTRGLYIVNGKKVIVK